MPVQHVCNLIICAATETLVLCQRGEVFGLFFTFFFYLRMRRHTDSRSVQARRGCLLLLQRDIYLLLFIIYYLFLCFRSVPARRGVKCWHTSPL